jgi:fluoride exporter
VIWLAVAMAGGLGAVCRVLVDAWVHRGRLSTLRTGATVANVTGSLAAGLVAALVAAEVVPDGFRTVVAGGFLGAYTTFSTAMVEVVEAGEASPSAAATRLLGPAVLAIGGAALGWGLGTLLVG